MKYFELSFGITPNNEAAADVLAGPTSSAPKNGEPLGGLAAAFDDAFGNIEWQPGEAESK